MPHVARWFPAFAAVLLAMPATSVMATSMTKNSAATQRIELPINQIKVGGNIWYTIPVDVDGKTITTWLDTGSTGLRVLASQLPAGAASATGREANTSFTDGQRLGGVLHQAQVSIGSSTAQTISIEDIKSVQCLADRPKCSAEKHSDEIDAAPGIGAILGASIPRSKAEFIVANLLLNFEDSWIIELPKPGKHTTGKLVINPTADEQKGFITFPSGQGQDVGAGRDNPIPGCLTNQANDRQFCGPVILDTGMPQIYVITDQFSDNRYWMGHTTGRLSFDKPTGGKLEASFVVSPRSPATRVNLGKLPAFGQPPQRVLAGQELFMLFDVLYDFKNRAIGLRLRN
jgi:hypothetical protein